MPCICSCANPGTSSLQFVHINPREKYPVLTSKACLSCITLTQQHVKSTAQSLPPRPAGFKMQDRHAEPVSLCNCYMAHSASIYTRTISTTLNIDAFLPQVVIDTSINATQNDRCQHIHTHALLPVTYRRNTHHIIGVRSNDFFYAV